MSRSYRSDNRTGVTSSKAESRRNRKLQLIVNNSFPGERGMTLLEKMEKKLDDTREERERTAAIWAADKEATASDSEHDAHLDWMLKSEGKIQGMLVMIAIMRSTTPKVELQRSKDRRKFNVNRSPK